MHVSAHPSSITCTCYSYEPDYLNFKHLCLMHPHSSPRICSLFHRLLHSHSPYHCVTNDFSSPAVSFALFLLLRLDFHYFAAISIRHYYLKSGRSAIVYIVDDVFVLFTSHPQGSQRSNSALLLISRHLLHRAAVALATRGRVVDPSHAISFFAYNLLHFTLYLIPCVYLSYT